MVSNLFVVLMGMGTVFFGLVCIVLLIGITSRVLHFLDKKEKTEEKLQPTVAPAETSAAETTASGAVDEGLMEAIIKAALAEELGVTPDDIMVRSITPAMSNEERGILSAVIAAAIASELGGNVSGLRIHSIRRLEPGEEI